MPSKTTIIAIIGTIALIGANITALFAEMFGYSSFMITLPFYAMFMAASYLAEIDPAASATIMAIGFLSSFVSVTSPPVGILMLLLGFVVIARLVAESED